MTLMIDPPSRWAYGFPKPYSPKVDNLEQMLRGSKYPEEDEVNLSDLESSE